MATWLDLATREVIGYSMAETAAPTWSSTPLTWPPASVAWKRAAPPHRPRIEYTSAQFRDRLGELKLRQSMGRNRICYDNAAAAHPLNFEDPLSAARCHRRR